ncbi:hypothetical protein JOF29_008032 [Kribbella aluminosa]|uniref:Uncharacterized protein n=1 Tax=Kribbella aluminosa TaxID=416017 RepID=A0ABS4UZ48_9ACTN|nr:hypothetical protein [Kribbella aluminosa]MBP2356922.1 hypothetical protein [Kribbella aluminosa]
MDGTGLPAASTTGVRTSRWQADDATLQAAVRFAVWGDTTPAPHHTETRPGPPSFATT